MKKNNLSSLDEKKILSSKPQAKSKGPNRSYDSAPANESATDDQAEAEAGTGFGEHQISHVRRVQFNAKRKATMKSFFKYEWRETLCHKKIIDCGFKYQKTQKSFLAKRRL